MRKRQLFIPETRTRTNILTGGHNSVVAIICYNISCLESSAYSNDVDWLLVTLLMFFFTFYVVMSWSHKSHGIGMLFPRLKKNTFKKKKKMLHMTCMIVPTKQPNPQKKGPIFVQFCHRPRSVFKPSPWPRLKFVWCVRFDPLKYDFPEMRAVFFFSPEFQRPFSCWSKKKRSFLQYWPTKIDCCAMIMILKSSPNLVPWANLARLRQRTCCWRPARSQAQTKSLGSDWWPGVAQRS